MVRILIVHSFAFGSPFLFPCHINHDLNVRKLLLLSMYRHISNRNAFCNGIYTFYKPIPAVSEVIANE
jgi:hypothetical protein